MEINLAALELLIRGESLPKNRAEELFLLAYKTGIEDELLMLTMIDIRDIFESLSNYEYGMFVMGFCLGQKTYREAIEEGIEFIKEDPSKTH